ncbi:hypothetical protein [Thauera sinica]|uniref:C-type lysozyme inhibitor domain-containing protein n=1 Tax=Thauera sinica TaxID=2665146 RepID=A0ABW1ANR4_9RHOO|nr:hypothetical protein [Thauera sp. K11]ATE61970.1 hypothetical protein CCZ27_20130 [Thauera sp. K11]
MILPRLALLAVPMLLLSACTTRPPAPPAASDAGGVLRNGQFEFTLASGEYHCELGVRLQIGREMRDQVNQRIQLAWNGRSYQLERDPSYSGLPRFEDVANGLVWIDLPWKGLLLDGRTQKPIANECRPA